MNAFPKMSNRAFFFFLHFKKHLPQHVSKQTAEADVESQILIFCVSLDYIYFISK